LVSTGAPKAVATSASVTSAQGSVPALAVQTNSG
jgi:hypothetical protein